MAVQLTDSYKPWGIPVVPRFLVSSSQCTYACSKVSSDLILNIFFSWHFIARCKNSENRKAFVCLYQHAQPFPLQFRGGTNMHTHTDTQFTCKSKGLTHCQSLRNSLLYALSPKY